jgi:transcriptional regulator with XRE-family HTH domain
MVTTDGCRALIAWLDDTKTSIAELARRVGVSGAAVSHWLDGSTRPETHHRLALSRLTGIPWRSWFTEDEAAKARGSGEYGDSGATGTD